MTCLTFTKASSIPTRTLALLWDSVQLTIVTTVSRICAREKFSYPRVFGTRPMNRMPLPLASWNQSLLASSEHSKSESFIAGTRLSLTNEQTSTEAGLLATIILINAIFSSTSRTTLSFCSPSRAVTSCTNASLLLLENHLAFHPENARAAPALVRRAITFCNTIISAHQHQQINLVNKLLHTCLPNYASRRSPHKLFPIVQTIKTYNPIANPTTTPAYLVHLCSLHLLRSIAFSFLFEINQ
mmetsp:Transcript_36853/g.59732  ORF Transcript_36853/g.59732 Transcript_36853/m.59732 type:complete len:242 (+) Transcript_36853:1613-2338(+)